MPSLSQTSADAVQFDWLLKLRWAALAGATALVTWGRLALDLELPLQALGLLLAVAASTNLALALLRPRYAPTTGLTTVVMSLDAVFLTALFYLTGGPSNPFNFLFLVHLALASVILPTRHAWGLVALGSALFGLLFYDHVPLARAGAHGAHGGHDMDLHLRGMWVAFVVAAIFIVTFVSRVTRTLATRERELARAREDATRSERLASLATLAAGAAHELATPLGTIALVARELELELADREAVGDEAVEDARLIGREVARCRDILQHLRADAADPGGEGITTLEAGQLARMALEGLPQAEQVALTLNASPTLHTYARTVASALRGLVKNALDASPPGASVDLRVAEAPGPVPRVVFEVEDHGEGMDAETLERIGEPFFTTKATGKGMGLGLFLARTLAERLGGHLSHRSEPGQGTVARLVLPTTPPDEALRDGGSP